MSDSKYAEESLYLLLPGVEFSITGCLGELAGCGQLWPWWLSHVPPSLTLLPIYLHIFRNIPRYLKQISGIVQLRPMAHALESPFQATRLASPSPPWARHSAAHVVAY